MVRSMPHRRRSNRLARKSRLARKRKSIQRRKQLVSNRTSVPVGLGFPKRMVMTHKYYEQINLTTGALGAFNSYTWSCNSLYDPNYSGTGHQPLYFDQMSSIYDHYTVIGSKIKIRVSDTTAIATNYVPLTVVCYINDDTTVLSNIFTAQEQSSAITRTIGNTFNNLCVFNRKWSAKKTFGGSVLGNDNLQGTSSASPTEQSYYTICIDSLSSSTASSTQIDVEIEYITVWDELRDIAGS